MSDVPERASRPRRLHRPRLRTLALAYLGLLAASHVVRWVDPYTPTPRPDQTSVELPAFVGDRPTEGTVRLAITDLPGPTADAPTIVLLHGSPVASISMIELGEALASSARVVIPDLPGLGRSTLDVPDVSVRAHGAALAALLERLGGTEVHLIGYSMGGGVAIEACRLAPERIASLTLLSSIGVQEFELLGDYHLNHAVHALQLGIIWAGIELVPHFGAFDGGVLGLGYARNFFETDQRPLRGILEDLALPTLVVHGRSDGLVPGLAAREHARIVPQSELVWFDGGHITPLRAPPRVVDPIVAFVVEVEAGRATTRAEASPERIATAAVPFDRHDFPGASGMALVVAMLLLALATFASEDLACIGAGILVAQGAIGFVPAAAACGLGIFFGDIGLFLAGRVLGRRIVKKAPFRWIIRERDLVRAAAWLDRRGVAVIFGSRFTPGLRLPTYVAAGILPTRFWWFTFYFVIATVVWTPALVGLATAVGRPALDFAIRTHEYAGWILLAELALIVLAIKLVIPLFSYRGRRSLATRWSRIRRFEYWPVWIFYPPLVIATIGQMIRFRSMSVFACANPGIEHGGFIGESKSAILRGLAGVGDQVARWRVIEPNDDPTVRAGEVRAFREENRLEWPIVLKPDAGERGSGVEIARDEADVTAYLANHAPRTIVQEYVPGREFGVFYVRYPHEETGRIFSITDKRVPKVTGDGERTLEHLILDDPARRPMASTYLALLGERALDVPAAGEEITLVEIGTHALGAIFLDGTHLRTPELEAEIDRISRTFEGFYFGRYDVRVPDEDALREARDIRVIELNGVSSEATNIYDPKHGFRYAQRVLREQWRMAFEIGAANRALGVREPGQWVLWKRLFTADPRPAGDLLARPAALEIPMAHDGEGEPRSGKGAPPARTSS